MIDFRYGTAIGVEYSAMTSLIPIFCMSSVERSGFMNVTGNVTSDLPVVIASFVKPFSFPLSIFSPFWL